MAEPPTPTGYRPDSKIVRRSEMDAALSASDYLSKARRAAIEARNAAEGELNEARELALATALNEARLTLMEETRSAAADARSALQASEDQLLGIVRDSVELIIGTVPEPERLRLVLKQAMARLEGTLSASLLVPPGEVAVTREEVARLTQSGGLSGIRSVDGDPLLSPGDMVIVTPQGRVQVGWRRQLERMIAAMRSPRDERR
ncbi:MAG: hypothetical protein KDI98_06705 [Hyphomicrobiaceae bacterium]|nr:hypothetical protein [Hyphomicrobiaceae bacterium]